MFEKYAKTAFISCGTDFVLKLGKINRIMSLLPIIYSSILIFSGIFIFVLIVSYVSFKIKSDENSYSESEKEIIEKRCLSKPQIRELGISDIRKRPNTIHHNQILKENSLHGKIIKPAAPETHSDYRRERRKLNEKNMQVLYKETDIFSRSKARTHEPRFSIIRNISENLGKGNKIVYAERPSFNTTQMIRSGAEDYLRFYENY